MNSSLTFRRDGRAIALFSRRNGTKLRLALGSYPKASRPELCDIKITDWCDVGCAFCYQDSTLLGKHASWENLSYVVEELAKAKVFEVALGGGETTAHPRFVELLSAFRTAGVVPNFTTKKPVAVRNLWPAIGDLVGGFAYSAETAAQVRSASKMLSSVPSEQVSLHYVMGLGSQQHFEDYLRAAAEVNYRVTLLGYKTTGRGKDVIPHPYSWWIQSIGKLIAEKTCPNISIDTPLADEYAGFMPVRKELFHTREGAYSMYVDAVALTMGASSFDEKETLLPFDSSWVQRYASL